MVTFCFEGHYYVLNFSSVDATADDVSCLLKALPDPADWRKLLQAATFIRHKTADSSCTPPSDELIEAIRQFMVADDPYSNRIEICADGMTCERLIEVPHVSRPELLPEMMATLEDPARFLNFCRVDAISRVPSPSNGWEWLGQVLEGEPEKLLPVFLEHGFFVYTAGPLAAVDADEAQIIINMDVGLFSLRLEQTPETKFFEMKSHPGEKWYEFVSVPGTLLELALAYTPTVKKKVMAEVEENLLLQLVLDSVAGPYYANFCECMELLEMVQDALRGETCINDVTEELGSGKIWLEEEDFDPSFFVALKLALLPVRDRISWPYNENTVSEDCYEYLSDLAVSDEWETLLPANRVWTIVPGELKELVIDGVKEMFRADRLNKFLSS